MSDPTAPDAQPETTDKPSQAEGEDPGDTTDKHDVLPTEGKPSQADG